MVKCGAHRVHKVMDIMVDNSAVSLKKHVLWWWGWLSECAV